MTATLQAIVLDCINATDPEGNELDLVEAAS
jgi:hypothetical protein